MNVVENEENRLRQVFERGDYGRKKWGAESATQWFQFQVIQRAALLPGTAAFQRSQDRRPQEECVVVATVQTDPGDAGVTALG